MKCTITLFKRGLLVWGGVGAQRGRGGFSLEVRVQSMGSMKRVPPSFIGSLSHISVFLNASPTATVGGSQLSVLSFITDGKTPVSLGVSSRCSHHYIITIQILTEAAAMIPPLTATVPEGWESAAFCVSDKSTVRFHS